MSFSSRVKDELSRVVPAARHCQIAETAALLGMCGTISADESGRYTLRIHTENVTVARKFFILLKEAFQVRSEIAVRQSHFSKKNRTYIVYVSDSEGTRRVLEAVKMISEDGEIGEDFARVRNIVLRQDCCRRSYIRGAFLAAGSISDPEKSYHYELVTSDPERADQLCTIISTFSIEAKIVVRKKYYVVYIKEGDQIRDMLGLMGADTALMDMENIRIVKDMRNSVNRQVNCETANINETVSAAVRQLKDIEYIRDTKGLASLPVPLKQMAELRLNAPDAPLVQLGTMLEPPVGKSGVNHRLRRISEIAEKLRQEQGISPE